MNKKIPLSILLLQALSLLGADYTAEDVQQLFRKIHPIKFKLPKDLPAYQALDSNTVKCGKCGKKMICLADPNLMEALVTYLNGKSTYFHFELDKSCICPHCGDGMFYLKINNKRDSRTNSLGKHVSAPVPINMDRLLLLVVVLTNDNSLIDNGDTAISQFYSSPFPFYYMDGNTFIVSTDSEYNAKIKAIEKNLPPEFAEHLAKRKKDEIARSKAFQQLTETSSILRKKDLDKFLKALATNRMPDSSSTMLTRMMITPDNHLGYSQITCPECKTNFHVLNGANHPRMSPFGDLLRILEKLDITPDYSSLCPQCHPGEKQRLLKATFHISGKDYAACLTPTDLALLNYVLRGTMHLAMNNTDVARLRNILQGFPDTSLISAKTVFGK